MSRTMSGIPTSGGGGDVTLAGDPNAFSGTNTYDVNRPTSTLTSTPAATDFITKQDGENLFTSSTGDALLAGSNAFTGTNSFNTNRPTSTLTSTISATDFLTKQNADTLYTGSAGDVQEGGNNVFTGTNKFDVNRPTSTLTSTPASTDFLTKQNADTLYGGGSGDAVLAAGTAANPQEFTGVCDFNGGSLQMTNANQTFSMIQTDINTSDVNDLAMTGRRNRITQNSLSNGLINEFKQSGGANTASSISQYTADSIIYQDATTAKIITNGKIGIGTTTPYCPLSIYGESGSMSSSSYRMFRYNAFFTSGTATWTPMGMYCEKPMLCGSWVVSQGGTLGASDKRIKKDIKDIPKGEAISLMRKLKPRKYKYIDERNERYEVAGFIADEVKEILPEGVKLFRQQVPNIFQFADLNDDILSFGDDYNVEKLSVDKPIQLMTKNDLPVEVNILKIDTSNNNIQIDINNTNDNLKDYTGNTSDTDNNKIFVYGEVVEDFKALKHEYLNTIMFQSVKEIDMEQQADKIKIKSLEERIAILEDKINNMP